MTDRDRTTRTRARAPGVGGVLHRMAVHDRVLRPDSERTTVATTRCTKGRCKLDGGRRMPGAGLSRRTSRKASLGKPAFQPYWGKLTVRNDRGDRGNVGIIRSPIRASILPDRMYGPAAAQPGCAGSFNQRGRASWARYPEIFKSEPVFRTKKEAWELFRIGPNYEVGGRRATFEGEQIPTDAFDQFMKP